MLPTYNIRLLMYCLTHRSVDQRGPPLTLLRQRPSALFNFSLFYFFYSLFFISAFISVLLFLRLCGDEGIRTPDLRRAKAALSQLSYIPVPGAFTLQEPGGPFRART